MSTPADASSSSGPSPSTTAQANEPVIIPGRWRKLAAVAGALLADNNEIGVLSTAAEVTTDPTAVAPTRDVPGGAAPAGCCGPARPGSLPQTAAVAASTMRPVGIAGHNAIPTLVEIPAGTFRMGSESAAAFPGDGEGPVREVTLTGYRIGVHTVTNAEYATFVQTSGYVTEAERYGWSYVFDGHINPEARASVMAGSPPATPWWRGVQGASWRAPCGPGSSIDAILDHPVVHVSHHDAVAYSHWCGARLPTEAEWEMAARGGLDQATYPWGDQLTPRGEHRCNIWQGQFPFRNTAADGYHSTAPASSFQPNGSGLYNCAGNVWEWTADWFSADWHLTSDDRSRTQPTGPETGTDRVTKGGSFLCHASYCNRYRPAARTHNTPDTSLSHTGFRIAADL